MSPRKSYRWCDGKFIELSPASVAGESSPTVISDEMPPTQHPCNGRFYTSKTKFREETKARGCEEVGNDWNGKSAGKVEPKIDREQLKRDIADVFSGYGH